MKKFTLITLVAVFGAALIGCQPAATTNANMKANMATANSNTAVVVNSNTTMGMNTNMGMNSNRYSSTMTREEYEKSTEYKTDQTASTIGQGANDKWIWFKTKAALAGVNDLRDSTVNVDVSNDVITLRGTVANAGQKMAAEAAAKGIEGQKGIKNQLQISAGDSMTNQTVGTGNSAMTNSNRK
jgi:osmotically-inducible protein OsmY